MDVIAYSQGAKANKRIAELTGDSRIQIPFGTTAERPTLGAGDRAIRYNTDESGLEEWNGTEWKNVSANISAVNLKGTDTEANILALTGMVAEDLWIASDTLDGYVYDGATWINIGPLQGPQGVQGIQGIPGTDGADGTGVDHTTRTSGDGTPGTTDTYTTWLDVGETQSAGTFSVYNGLNGTDVDHVTRTAGTGAAGTTDTYTLWGDVGETVNLGTFTVYNGTNGAGAVASIVAGTNVTIDATDPANPIVNVGDALPDQTANIGKYLTTDGTTASWAEVVGSEHYNQEATPVPNATGATWYVPSTGVLYKYVNDGVSDLWIDISTAGAGDIQVSGDIDCGNASTLETSLLDLGSASSI